MPLTWEVVEVDLPLAFLVGHDRRLQPLHPDPLAQRGLTAFREGDIDGVARHVEHTALHDTGLRAVAQVTWPGLRRSDPRTALCDLMQGFALAAVKDLSAGWEPCHGVDAHDYGMSVLMVDGEPYEAVELREHGVVARAAVVSGGWTVLACVPEGQQLAVKLEHLPVAAA